MEGKLVDSEGKGFEGHEVTIHGVEGLRELKRMLSKVYKFRKYNSVADFGLALKGGFSTSESEHADASTHFHFDKKYEGRWKHLKDDINFASMKHQRTGEDIRYFGKKSGEKRAWFKVEPRGEYVVVEEISIDEKESKLKKTYEKKMTANDFMMFAMEKDLRGYTQEEVDQANDGKAGKGMPIIIDNVDTFTQPESRFGKGLFHVKWGSLA